MSINSSVYPACDTPGKFQMEELFRRIEATPKMIADFGLVEQGDNWQITVSLSKARKAFGPLYDSLSKRDKIYFQTGYFALGLEYLRDIVTNCEQAGMDAGAVQSLKGQLAQLTKTYFEVAMAKDEADEA